MSVDCLVARQGSVNCHFTEVYSIRALLGTRERFSQCHWRGKVPNVNFPGNLRLYKQLHEPPIRGTPEFLEIEKTIDVFVCRQNIAAKSVRHISHMSSIFSCLNNVVVESWYLEKVMRRIIFSVPCEDFSVWMHNYYPIQYYNR